MKTSAYKRQLTANARAKRSRSPSRMDPTRTTPFTKGFLAALRKRWLVLKRRVQDLVLKEDALGLKLLAVVNYDPDQPRDEKGRFGSGGNSPSEGDSSSLNPDVTKRLVSLGKESGREHSIVLDKQGKEIATSVGDEGSIDLSGTKDLYREGAGLRVAHNHPDNSMLSPQDLRTFVTYPGVDEITAVTHDGNIYTATIKGDRKELSKRVDEELVRINTIITDRLMALDSPTLQDRQNLKRLKFEMMSGVAEKMHAEGRIRLSRNGVVINYDPDQPRDERGRFGLGGGSSSTQEEGYEKSLATPYKAERDPTLLSKLGAPGRWMSSKTKQLYSTLEGRYGRTAAIAIMSSGQALAWGATAAGALYGKPIWLPGSSLWGAIPGAAIAEGILQLSRGVNKIRSLSGNADTNLSQEEIEQLGREFYEKVLALAEQGRKRFGDLTDVIDNSTTVNTRWAGKSSPEKLKAFQEWLKQQVVGVLRGQNERALWETYIKDGFKRGAGRAFDDTKKPVAEAAKQGQTSVSDFYKGTKDEFLRSSFAQPVAVDKVQLLASRTFEELEAVTDEMTNKLSRVLTDGLVTGSSPHEIARNLTDQMDISRDRAEVIARTEIIRAHAEGQLTALEQLGVEEVGVAVEWSSTGDDKVCPKCSDLEGIVLKLSEARGLLPRHPNCRCAWIPANVGEDDEGQKDTAPAIREAMETDDDWGPAEIDEERPQSILNVLVGDK